MADCILCGERFGPGRKRTNEHVFPEWLEKFFVPEGGGTVPYKRRFQRRGEPMQRREWEDIPFNMRVRNLCQPCNNEWCNEIETEAKPLLIPMLYAKSVRLDAQAQTSLAIWATKTMLMLQMTHHDNQRSVEQDAFGWFRRNRWPLSNEQIWIARYDGEGDWPVSYRHYGMLINKKDSTPHPPNHVNAHITSISVGHLVFLLFGHTIEDRPSMSIKPGTPAAATLRPIWPALGDSVEFPPPGLVVGNDGLDAMTGSLGDIRAFHDGTPQVQRTISALHSP